MASAGISVGGRGPVYGSGGGISAAPYGSRAFVPEQTSQADARMPVRKNISKRSDGSWTEDTEYGEGTEENLRIRDKYNAQAEARRQAALQALMAQSGGGSGAGAGGDGQIKFDEQAARDAAFARAKDRAGQTARASLNALREQMGGNLGGALEQQRSAEIIGGAAGTLGDFERDQLGLDLNRAGEISDRNYAGGLEREKMAQDKLRSLYALFSEGKGPIY